jgi:DNA-binding Lrp family transcriptional regulator
MTRAYILTALKPGVVKQAVSELRMINDIEKISVTAGEYDIVVRVAAPTMEDILGVANEIQQVNGVKKTMTQVVGKEITL